MPPSDRRYDEIPEAIRVGRALFYAGVVPMCPEGHEGQIPDIVCGTVLALGGTVLRAYGLGRDSKRKQLEQPEWSLAGTRVIRMGMPNNQLANGMIAHGNIGLFFSGDYGPEGNAGAGLLFMIGERLKRLGRTIVYNWDGRCDGLEQSLNAMSSERGTLHKRALHLEFYRTPTELEAALTSNGQTL